MLWVCVVDHHYYRVGYMLWKTCCGVHVVGYMLWTTLFVGLWVTCCGDVYTCCGEQLACVVGDTRVPHNTYFWCCPQHVTHKISQGCCPQHMPPVPHNTSHALHNLKTSRQNDLHQIVKTTKDMLRGYPLRNMLWTTSYMLWMHVVEYNHMLWSAWLVGVHMLWTPYIYCGDMLWTTPTHRISCGWRYVVGDVFFVLSTTCAGVLHNTHMLWRYVVECNEF